MIHDPSTPTKPLPRGRRGEPPDRRGAPHLFKPSRLLLLLAAVAAGGALWWWLQQRPPAVALTRPQTGPAVEAVYATGTVEPVRWSQVASTETGRIVEYPVAEGQRVEAGDLLVQLDDALLRAGLRELVSRVRFLEGDVVRYQALLAHDNVSRQVYEQKLSELEQARAAVAAAEERVADMAIRAPLGGVVLRRDHEVGEVVAPGEGLVWVGRERPYWITAFVDEEDIPRVRPGQEALVKADAFPGRALEAEVAEVTPKGDPVNKQYRVRLLLPVDSPLMIGMTAEVNIVVRRDQQALLVPERALDGASVLVVEEDRAIRRAVELGVYGDGLVEIRSGLTGDESLVLDPPPGLSAPPPDGAPVRVSGAGS